MIKILAISGSLRQASRNMRLLKACQLLASEGTAIDIFDH